MRRLARSLRFSDPEPETEIQTLCRNIDSNQFLLFSLYPVIQQKLKYLREVTSSLGPIILLGMYFAYVPGIARKDDYSLLSKRRKGAKRIKKISLRLLGPYQLCLLYWATAVSQKAECHLKSTRGIRICPTPYLRKDLRIEANV